MTPILQPTETAANLRSLACYCSADRKNDVQYLELYIMFRAEEKENKKQLLLVHINAPGPDWGD